jgi:tetratricopeptide (TPR) repeat protein
VVSQAPSSAGASAGAEGERLLRATRAMQLRDYEAAARLLSQEAEEQPGSFLAYDLRAACSLQAGRHEQALDDAMHCTKLNPDW